MKSSLLNFGSDTGTKQYLPKSAFNDNWGSYLKGSLRLAGFFFVLAYTIPLVWLNKLFGSTEKTLASRHFCHRLLKLLGMRIITHGTMSTAQPTMFVANHTSYLDIPVLGSTLPAYFVAKADIAQWPVFGWLTSFFDHIFVERKRSKAAEQRNQLSDRLKQGDSIIIFPEGTTSDGQTVLSFVSSLFSITEIELPNGGEITVQPVSLTPTRLDGMPLGRILRPFYAWYGDMGFAPHLWRSFCLGHFTVELVFHPPVTAKQFANRKEMAKYCQQQVAKGVEQCLKGRHESTALLTAPKTLPESSHE